MMQDIHFRIDWMVGFNGCQVVNGYFMSRGYGVMCKGRMKISLDEQNTVMKCD